MRQLLRLHLHLHFGQLTFNRTRACFQSIHFRNSFVRSHMSQSMPFMCCARHKMGSQSTSFNYRPEENRNASRRTCFVLLVFNKQQERNENVKLTHSMLNNRRSVLTIHPKAEHCVADGHARPICVSTANSERIYAKMNCKYRGKWVEWVKWSGVLA